MIIKNLSQYSYFQFSQYFILLVSIFVSINAHALKCSYQVTNDWGPGFTGSIVITNDGTTPVNGWQVQWQQNGGSTLTSLWNATYSGTNPYTATGSGWNSNIPAGGSVSFGFQGNGDNSTATILSCTSGATAISSISVSSSRSSSLSSSRSFSSSVSLSRSSMISQSSSINSSLGLPAVTLQENTIGFCRVDGAVDNNNAGFTGTGFANTTNAVGTQIVWKLFANNSGNYQFEIRFANGGTAARSGQLSINNGANGTYNLNLPATGAWTSWQTISIPVVLSQGENQLVLTATTSGGLANVDYAKVFGVGLTPRDCVTTTAPNITVWLAGDSTVANGGSVCPIGWGRNFASNFDSRVTVQNLAAGGRSVRTWLYDVQSTMGADGECLLNYNTDGTPVLQARWQTMLNGMKSGDYLFIQFGINDGDRTCPRHVGAAAFMQAYTMMAKAAQARGATPIFITPVSAIACSGSTAIATRGFLSETQSAGNANGVKVIDLHTRSIQLYNSRAFCPIPGGTDITATTGGAVGAFFCDDHTHFDTAGANDIGVLVVQAIRNLNIPLAQYLK